MRCVENARRRTDPARNRKSKERAPETEGSPNKTKEEKEKKESLAHIRKISVNYFARKSLRSFLPFFSSRSLERRGEYLGYLGNRIDSKLENLASLETAKMLLSLVSRWIRVAPGGRVHTHTHTDTHTYIYIKFGRRDEVDRAGSRYEEEVGGRRWFEAT